MLEGGLNDDAEELARAGKMLIAPPVCKRGKFNAKSDYDWRIRKHCFAVMLWRNHSKHANGRSSRNSDPWEDQGSICQVAD